MPRRTAHTGDKVSWKDHRTFALWLDLEGGVGGLGNSFGDDGSRLAAGKRSAGGE